MTSIGSGKSFTVTEGKCYVLANNPSNTGIGPTGCTVIGWPWYDNVCIVKATSTTIGTTKNQSFTCYELS